MILLPPGFIPFLFFLLLFPYSSSHHNHSAAEFCADTAECLAKIRRMAAGTDRFWFGDQWTRNCGGAGHHRQHAPNGPRGARRHARGNPVDCVNPVELAPFTSLGSRLFRVHTFTNAYLAQLRVFPRLRFPPQSGSYRACGHQFDVSPPADHPLPGHPSARPLPSFQAQHVPSLSWPELRPNQSLVVAMVDVGFGHLNYLAVDFPRNTQVIRPYRPIDNFRPRQPNPLTVLIFEPPDGEKEKNATMERIREKWAQKEGNEEEEGGGGGGGGGGGEEEQQFDLSQFMIETGLDRGLIGLNWALIDGDPFGIERQRLRGMPDNCHSLVLHKLLRDRRWNFVDSFALSSELDTWLSVSVLRPHSTIHDCCFSASVEEQQLFLDPLADHSPSLPSVAFRNAPPVVSSIWPMVKPDQQNSIYQRASRHYIVPFREERYTLVLFDPARHFLHWLIVDIPAEGLASGNILDQSTPVAPYLAPVPARPGQCLFALFMLFRQPRSPGHDQNSPGGMADFFNTDHPLRQRMCQEDCPHRMDFDIEQFKALHRLHLSAINWARVCYDLFEASRQISLIRKSPELREGVDRTAKLGGGGGEEKGRKRMKPEGGNKNNWRRRSPEEWKSEKQRQIGAICAQFNVTEEIGAAATISRRDPGHCEGANSVHPVAQFRFGMIILSSFWHILLLRWRH